MSVRQPDVAGSFYPAGAEALAREVDEALVGDAKERPAAVVVPHAGYVYSGKVAGATYGRVDLPRDVVILCFNHRGRGGDFAIWPEGAWRTPLGDAPINAELASRIRDGFDGAEFDETGHRGEHSGEVQVPFLQRMRSDVRIVPIALSTGLDDATFGRLRDFGRALAELKDDFLVVCSTDLNHYEDQKTTVKKDEAVIREIEKMDAEGLRRTLASQKVSMCGYAPTIAAIEYGRAKGVTEGRTVMHATSGDASGDFDRVVGYVGMMI